jgi:N-acetylmuramoyl-L-alanine amidase
VLRAAALLVCLLATLSACAVGERPTLSEDGSASLDGAGDDVGAGSAASEPTTSPPPLEDGAVAAVTLPSTTVTPSPLPALAALGADTPPVLISPTGLLVPVLGRTGTGYRVLTPCGVEADLVFGQPVWEAEVVLDPGHGGDEQGALGPDGEAEAELNLDIARRAAALLEAQGISATLTRTADYRIPIRNRAAIADQLQARAFVSIHHNSPTPEPSDIPGTEVYVQSGNAESSRLGGLLYEEIVAALSVYDVAWTSRSDAGVLTVLDDQGENAYGITRYPTTPVALAELAYLSNPSEAVVLATPEYRQAASVAVSEAVARFLTTTDPGSGFVANPRLFNPSGDTGGTDGCVDPALS